MQKVFKAVLIIACIAAAALCVLPVMSVYLRGGESGTLHVRGYNLMEFSPWGCIPLFAPLLIIPVLCGSLTKQAERLLLTILFVGDMVCYMHSVSAARDWLAALDGSPVAYHPGLFLIPIVLGICIGFSRLFTSVVRGT